MAGATLAGGLSTWAGLKKLVEVTGIGGLFSDKGGNYSGIAGKLPFGLGGAYNSYNEKVNDLLPSFLSGGGKKETPIQQNVQVTVHVNDVKDGKSVANQIKDELNKLGSKLTFR